MALDHYNPSLCSLAPWCSTSYARFAHLLLSQVCSLASLTPRWVSIKSKSMCSHCKCFKRELSRLESFEETRLMGDIGNSLNRRKREGGMAGIFGGKNRHWIKAKSLFLGNGNYQTEQLGGRMEEQGQHL